ncbi:hypothetical protein LR48_Vigan252s005700 [Vigna angularis]|uniref:Uncharacterized protein n=1 Tax=Phaseolus angularis TaxID=3914 RepID=A0A0L9T6W5_PHAAN|nr:hypothetical protein LR48_Vigan252s005700 [Vigna angularis]
MAQNLIGNVRDSESPSSSTIFIFPFEHFNRSSISTSCRSAISMKLSTVDFDVIITCTGKRLLVMATFNNIFGGCLGGQYDDAREGLEVRNRIPTAKLNDGHDGLAMEGGCPSLSVTLELVVTTALGGWHGPNLTRPLRPTLLPQCHHLRLLQTLPPPHLRPPEARFSFKNWLKRLQV